MVCRFISKCFTLTEVVRGWIRLQNFPSWNLAFLTTLQLQTSHFNYFLFIRVICFRRSWTKTGHSVKYRLVQIITGDMLQQNKDITEKKHNFPYETPVCSNPHNSSHWDSHTTGQLGHKHAFFRNLVSPKIAFFLRFIENITCLSVSLLRIRQIFSVSYKIV